MGTFIIIKTNKKSPAYGRQSISQQMRIVYHKNLYLIDLMINDLLSLNSPKTNKKLCGNFTPFLIIFFFILRQLFFHYFSPMILNLLKYWTFDFVKWGQKDI